MSVVSAVVMQPHKIQRHQRLDNISLTALDGLTTDTKVLPVKIGKSKLYESKRHAHRLACTDSTVTDQGFIVILIWKLKNLHLLRGEARHRHHLLPLSAAQALYRDPT